MCVNLNCFWKSSKVGQYRCRDRILGLWFWGHTCLYRWCMFNQFNLRSCRSFWCRIPKHWPDFVESCAFSRPDFGKKKTHSHQLMNPNPPIVFHQATFKIRGQPKFQAHRNLTIHLVHSWVGQITRWTATMAQFDHQKGTSLFTFSPKTLEPSSINSPYHSHCIFASLEFQNLNQAS